LKTIKKRNTIEKSIKEEVFYRETIEKRENSLFLYTFPIQNANVRRCPALSGAQHVQRGAASPAPHNPIGRGLRPPFQPPFVKTNVRRCLGQWPLPTYKNRGTLSLQKQRAYTTGAWGALFYKTMLERQKRTHHFPLYTYRMETDNMT
jgi:hypothetical protein